MDQRRHRKRMIGALGICFALLLLCWLLIAGTDVVAVEFEEDRSTESGMYTQNVSGKTDADHISATYVQALWEKMKEGMKDTEALADLGFEVCTQGEKEDHAWFKDEIFEVPAGESIVVDTTGSLVYFALRTDECHAWSRVNEQLSTRGWVEIKGAGDKGDTIDAFDAINAFGALDRSGQKSERKILSQSTYRKEGGSCRWLMISMMEVGDEVGVTMHIQRV